MKKFSLVLAVVALSVSITACFNNLSFPKSVSVKTNAQYNFTMAKITQDMGKVFDLDSYMKSTEDFKIYDYNPAGNSRVKKYLMKMPIQEIPVDFQAYLDDSILKEYIDNMKIKEQSFTIPKVDLNKTQAVDIGSINDMINTMVTVAGTTSDLTKLDFTFEPGNHFDEIAYKTGYLRVSGVDDKLTGKASLLFKDSSSYKEISSADFNSRGEASIPIDNKSIYSNNLYMKFTESSGKPFIAVVETGSKIKTAKGISVKDEIDIPVSTSFDVGSSNPSLHSCTFGAGSKMNITFTYPTDWTGVSVTALNIKLSGGMTPDFNIGGGSNSAYGYSVGPEDLEGHTFINKPINADAKMKMQLNGANLNFEGKPTIAINTAVTTLDAKIRLDDNFNVDIDNEKIFTEETKKMLKKITWNPSGIKVFAKNTFPTGNDIDFSLTSHFFGDEGFFDSEGNPVSGSATGNATILSDTTTPQEFDFLCPQDRETVIGDTSPAYRGVDFKAGLAFNNYFEEDSHHYVVFKSVEMGKTYSIKIDIQPVFDWKSETMNTSSSNQKGKVSTDIKVSALFDGFDTTFPGSEISKKMKIRQVPIYMYCEVPNIDTFADYKFVGNIKSYIADTSVNPSDPSTWVQKTLDEETVYLLGSNDGVTDIPDQMPMRSVPAFTLNEQGSVITDYSHQTPNGDIAPIINSENAGEGVLCLDYDVSLATGGGGEEVIINKEDIPKLSGKSINITAIIVLSMDFNVTEDVNIDMSTMLAGMSGNYDSSDPKSDLLGRPEPQDYDDIKKILEIIEYVTVNAVASDVPFLTSEPIFMNVDLDGAYVPATESEPEHGNTFEPTALNINNGSFTVNPVKLLNTYPIHPSLTMKIAKGTFSLPRSMNYSTSVNLKIQTDGTYELFGGGAE